MKKTIIKLYAGILAQVIFGTCVLSLLLIWLGYAAEQIQGQSQPATITQEGGAQ